jgi:RNA polymerase sigma-70 factor (ECF subfamily)
MLFTLCHPAIAPEAQIALSLRILCGFSIDEIATAFLTNKETINKRLFRAKQILREKKVQIGHPGGADMDARLNIVLTTLYLLFSEGYYSENKEEVIREELCYEAMRLTWLLTESDSTGVPKVNALYALMCLQASRLPARKHSNGEIILYADQDESLWNRELISRGAYYLHKASVGSSVSKYHLEAAIAYWHTVRSDTQEKWEHVLQLYDRLLQTEYSAVAALNRTYALSRAKGKEEAIKEAEKLDLTDNPFYFALLGELYTGLDNQKAIELFGRAATSAKTASDKHIMLKRRDAIGR